MSGGKGGALRWDSVEWFRIKWWRTTRPSRKVEKVMIRLTILMNLFHSRVSEFQKGGQENDEREEEPIRFRTFEDRLSE